LRRNTRIASLSHDRSPGVGLGKEPRQQSCLKGLQGDRGANLLEYAFILLLFLALLFGITGFSQLLYAYHFVDHAAKSAARWAAVNGYTCGPGKVAGTPLDGSCNGTDGMNDGPADPADVSAYVQTIVPPGIDATSTGCGGSACLQVLTTWPVQPSTSTDPSPAICSQAVPDDLGGVGPHKNYPGCTVQVQVQYKYNFVFPLIRTSPVTLTSTSQMVISH
jgi:TadE-like protein